MSTSESFRALRRANPRARDEFALAVEHASEAVGARIASVEALGEAGSGAPRARRRALSVAAAGAALGGAAVVAALSVSGSPDGSGVANAAAAVKAAATVTAAAAEQSGTAVVRMTHGGELWAARTIRWNGDMAVSDMYPRRADRPGSAYRVVDGTLYSRQPDGSWVNEGSPANIDPDSGTTPGEHLAAVREDVGGERLRRITGGMQGLTARELADGSTVYSGAVAAGLIARETGVKDGQLLRVLPFGYVAHDEASDPAAPLDTTVTVGADGVVREIAVRWGAGGSAWTYTVTYSDLGETELIPAPPNARSLLEERMRGRRDG